jgi:site-specific recombinase
MNNTWHFLLDKDPGLDLAIEVIDQIRPRKNKEIQLQQSGEKLSELIDFLRQHEGLKKKWADAIQALLLSYDPGYLYRERSFLGNSNLYAKFWKLFQLKILPKAIPDNEMDKLLDLLFKEKRDYQWVKRLPSELWEDLFKQLDLVEIFRSNQQSRHKLSHNITLISNRIASLGMDSDILNKLPELNDRQSPFLAQNVEVMKLLEKLDNGESIEGDRVEKLLTILDQCQAHITDLREKKRDYGISLHLTYISKRLLQQIDRIQLLLEILLCKVQGNFYSNFTRLFTEMLEYQEVKNSIRKLMRESVNLLAFEIVEHTAQKGEKYIAGTKSEYWRFLRKSLLGGFIIAIFASFKIQLSKGDYSPLGEGLLYGLNYAVAFVLVYMLGGLIATKQPAMTASSIVNAIDKDEGDSVHYVKNMIIRVSRSQFVSFLGNLGLAFPMAIVISYAYIYFGGAELLDVVKSKKLMADLQPLTGGAYYFAAIAGIILSLSGLISGYFDNKVVYSDLQKRICAHPFLKKRIAEKYLQRFAKYLYKNAGALAGNISLGFLLGLAGAIGFFTGIPLDIRHVAFSSANLGFALHFESFSLDLPTLFTLIIGVLGIGLINFLVSFGITFWIAMRSRNATFSRFKQLALALAKHFITKPHHFFLPFRLK